MSKFREWWYNKFTPWWNDKIVDNFHSETRDNGEGLGRFLNGVDNLWNRITGSGLTGAEREANQYSAAQAEDQYNREVEFYEKYQSPKAMMQQGVNPFSINGSTGGHTASGGSPSSVAPQGAEGLSGLMGLVQSIFGMQQQKRLNDSQINLNNSAVRRNDAESTEREINAETLRDMNVAEIMEKLSNIELNNSNIKLIASKILNTDADTSLKGEQLRKVAAEVLNIEADTKVKAEQLNVMFAEIANMNADTDVKRQQIRNLIHDIVVERKQLDVFSAQIALMGTQAGLNRSQAVKVQSEWRKLEQDYGRDQLLNTLSAMILSKEASDSNYRNPASYDGIWRDVRAFLNEFEDIFSISVGN